MRYNTLVTTTKIQREKEIKNAVGVKYSRKLENYLIGNQFTKLKSMSDCSCHSLNGTHIIEKSMK